MNGFTLLNRLSGHLSDRLCTFMAPGLPMQWGHRTDAQNTGRNSEGRH